MVSSTGFHNKEDSSGEKKIEHMSLLPVAEVGNFL